ncbi:hypothetical protein [Pseudomonas helleri]|uniref:hypothetical protein n=1 Tax=Pseudomonas helleri TaxID=1608996 RepID=UPI0030D9D046
MTFVKQIIYIDQMRQMSTSGGEKVALVNPPAYASSPQRVMRTFRHRHVHAACPKNTVLTRHLSLTCRKGTYRDNPARKAWKRQEIILAP